ncbi:TonB-dependent receptor domain-containing protein [Sphingomonas hankookensis]
MTAMVSGQALAQVAVAPVPQEDEIVVTGTNIRGAPVIGSSVQRIDADELARRGDPTLAEIFRELPSNFAGGVGSPDNSRGGQDASPAGPNLTGGSGINLRGLGSLSTLVLVNGRRVAASGQLGDFVDISNLPLAAIDRVEIFQDGGSALYGSDAVGGVVNIILKDRQEGVRALGRAGIGKSGEAEAQASLVGGTDWGSGHGVLGYEFNFRDNILANDRGFNGGDLSGRGGIDWPRYTSRAGAAANIFAGAAAFNGAVAHIVPQGPGTGLTVAQLTPATGGFGNSFDPWDRQDILPEMRRHSVFASITQQLGVATAFARGRYTRRDGNYSLGYAPIFGTVPSTNPAFITGTTNNFGVLVDDRPLTRDVRVNSYAGEAGLRARPFGDWTAEAIVSYSREEQRRDSTLLRDSNVGERLSNGTFAPTSIACALSGLNGANIGAVTNATEAQRFCASLNYATFNPYSSQPLSDQVLGQLIGYETLVFTSRTLQGTVKVDGTVFDLPGGPFKLAGGIDWRRETIDGDLDFNYRSLAARQVPYGVTEQKVFSAFAEAALPLVGNDNAIPGIAALDLSAAVRHERSDDLSGFATTNPRFGIRYAPVSGFNLRGSWGTSFHAAPMRFQYEGPQPVAGGNGIFYANAFYTAPCNTTLVGLNGFTGTPGGAGNCTFTGMVVTGGAGPTLKPERADTWSVGIDIAPPAIPGFSVSLNYFNLRVRDRLVRITSGALAGILSNYFATGNSSYIANLDFSPDLSEVQALFDDPRFLGVQGPGPSRRPEQIQAIIRATQSNLAALKMEGVDFSVGYAFDLGKVGRLGVFGNGTLITGYALQATPGAAFQDRLGQYESVGNPVPLRFRSGLDWANGGFSARGTLNYVDGYECAAGCYVPGATGAPVLSTTPVPIDAWATIDLQLGYAFANGLGVALSVNNAFDNDPPFIDTGRVVTGNAPEPYDGANASILGRTVALTVSKQF